jgi:hypothetical protein
VNRESKFESLLTGGVQRLVKSTPFQPAIAMHSDTLLFRKKCDLSKVHHKTCLGAFAAIFSIFLIIDIGEVG